MKKSKTNTVNEDKSEAITYAMYKGKRIEDMTIDEMSDALRELHNQEKREFAVLLQQKRKKV